MILKVNPCKTILFSEYYSEKTYISSADHVKEILVLTMNFQNYLKAYDINDSKRLKIDDIKETDGVYPGREIFNFVFAASKCNINSVLNIFQIKITEITRVLQTLKE